MLNIETPLQLFPWLYLGTAVLLIIHLCKFICQFLIYWIKWFFINVNNIFVQNLLTGLLLNHLILKGPIHRDLMVSKKNIFINIPIIIYLCSRIIYLGWVPIILS